MLNCALILPGSIESLLTVISPRLEIKIRGQLRRLERDTDSTLVVLWIIDGGPRCVLEFSGEIAARPLRFPDIESTVPSYSTVVDRDGHSHDAVIHSVRLGRGMPGLGLAVVDFGCAPGAALLDAVEDYGEAVAEMVVEAEAEA